MAATTNGPSMALPSRRTPMWSSVHSHVAPIFRLVVRRVRTDVAPLFHPAPDGGVRLLGRAMLGPLVVAAINYDFVGTD